jgi:hypothetical protein
MGVFPAPGFAAQVVGAKKDDWVRVIPVGVQLRNDECASNVVDKYRGIL